jgi:hypothetical protein
VGEGVGNLISKASHDVLQDIFMNDDDLGKSQGIGKVYMPEWTGYVRLPNTDGLVHR